MEMSLVFIRLKKSERIYSLLSQDRRELLEEFIARERLSTIEIEDQIRPELISYPYYLFLDEDGILKLQRTNPYGSGGTGKEVFSPFYIDLMESWRKISAHPPRKDDPMVKALGFKGRKGLVVMDLTCGLARDTLMMLKLGATVKAVERSSLLSLMLRDAMCRASDQNPFLHDLFQHQLCFYTEESKNFLQRFSAGEFKEELGRPDMIYLDPMYDESSTWKRRGQAGKEMRILKEWVGKDEDAQDLLPLALQVAKERVVVKRPRKGPYLHNLAPFHSYLGNSVRYDMYRIFEHGRCL